MSPPLASLYVFEGPDGVGKTELSSRLVEQLRNTGVDCEYLAFPGRDDGTLGKLIYDLHHKPDSFGITRVDSASLQLLHVAAHVDAIRNRILPALQAGRTVVLDRFWWSTLVYGEAAGVPRSLLKSMLAVEAAAWGTVTPTILFLVLRDHPIARDENPGWSRLIEGYERLARQQSDLVTIRTVRNDGTVAEALARTLRECLDTRPAANDGAHSTSSQHTRQLSLLHYSAGPPQRSDTMRTAPTPTRGVPHLRPTPVFETYWRFAVERQAVFFRRFHGSAPPWTADPILARHKFTNAYRASDRVSQFLIRRIIYEGDQSPHEVFFRILLFKLFNRIDTWNLLTQALGTLTFRDYSFARYDAVLTSALRRGERIYSAAYIMPSGGRRFAVTKKHHAHLWLLERMLDDDVPLRLLDMKHMQTAFNLLRSYPMIGDFLAYQYVTDLNYSELTPFSEMEFVVPGPGARDGIQKCFDSLGGYSEADVIKMVAENQNEGFSSRELHFQTLWGRPLQLIDCQSLFCEVDKYARAKHPEIAADSGRTRIKQMFRPDSQRIEYWYPPKWDLNDKVAGTMLSASQSPSDLQGDC